jgi:type IV pilus assembly protein PilX
MMKKTCNAIVAPMNNEGGFTMILALILLMLLTVIGIAAINTSTTETMITSADEEKRTAFHAAESAIQQASAQLNQVFREQFQPGYNANNDPTKLKWSFALKDPDPTYFVGSALSPASFLWKDRFASGVKLTGIPDDTLLGNGYTYSVRIWNNADSPDPTAADPPYENDTDGLLVLGVIAKGPHKLPVAVEVTLNGGLNGTTPVGTYTAQAGGGAGKNYNASDVGAISVGNMGGMGNAGGLF